MSVGPLRKPVGLSWTKKTYPAERHWSGAWVKWTWDLFAFSWKKIEYLFISLYHIISTSCPIYYFVYLHYFPLLSPVYLNTSSLYPHPNSMKVSWANSSTLSQGSKGDLAIPGPVPHWSWRLVQLRRPDLLEPTRRSAWRPAEGRA